MPANSRWDLIRGLKGQFTKDTAPTPAFSRVESENLQTTFTKKKDSILISI